MSDCLLKLDNVSKTFKPEHGTLRKQVFADLCFSLSKGEQLFIQGKSGAGKSSLLNCIAGLLKPDQGKLFFAGQDIYGLSEAARDRLRAQHIGYIYQTHNLFHKLRVFENLTLPLQIAQGSDFEVIQAEQSLRDVGLWDYRNAYPSQLSVGQRQRVAIARVMAQKPALLLADEPTASLDDESAQLVHSLLQSFCNHGVALVLVSHDIRFAGTGSTIELT